MVSVGAVFVVLVVTNTLSALVGMVIALRWSLRQADAHRLPRPRHGRRRATEEMGW
jgi:hypothetical protein